MEFSSDVWGVPLLVLALSAAFGVWNAMRIVGRDGDASIRQQTRRIDLESTHEEVLDALRQLELDKDKLEPSVYAREREELLARGAGALRALEADDQAHQNNRPATDPPAVVPIGAGPSAVAPIGAQSTSAAPPPAISPEWRGALTMLAVIAVLFVLYNIATQQSVERREGASMTGNQSLGAPQDPSAAFRNSPAYKERLAALTERLKANASDVEALNELSLLYINGGDPQAAFAQNEAALKIDEKNADARTLRAVLTAMMGMEDRALETLDQVLADEPAHTMANMFRARLLLVKGRPADAIASLEQAVARNPSDIDLARFLADTRREIAQFSQAPAAAGGQVLVSGTLVIDPALAGQLAGTETLFLSVADPARPRPPVAADKRGGPFTFPLPFELTTAHIRAMPGAGGVPAALDFKARFDADGDAMTVEPLPRVTVTAVKTGTTGVTVTLGLADAPVPASAVGGTAAAPAPGGSDGLLAPAKPPPIPGAGAGGGAVLAAGVATVDPARQSEITGAETVFVSVLDPAGGPPLAVARAAARFPLEFRVTTDNIIPMAGNRPIPDTVVLSIRVDQDGSASTKVGEPEARLASVAKGATGIAVTLK